MVPVEGQEKDCGGAAEKEDTVTRRGQGRKSLTREGQDGGGGGGGERVGVSLGLGFIYGEWFWASRGLRWAYGLY